MGIYKNGKGVDYIYKDGRAIRRVYRQNMIVWEFIRDKIQSCYHAGYWIDEYPWTDDTPWTD